MTAVPLDNLVVQPWYLTNHAREQAAERGVAIDEIYAVLAQPLRSESCEHSNATVTTRRYCGYGIHLIVDEETRTVITVGLDKSSKTDWESDALTRKSSVPWASSSSSVVEIRPVPAAMPSGRRRNQPKPEFWTRREADPLAKLHPAVRAAVEAELTRKNLTVADLRVISPTRVEFLK